MQKKKVHLKTVNSIRNVSIFKQVMACCLFVFLGSLTFAQTGANDLNFNIGAGANGVVYGSVVQPDNKIIVVGDFTSYNGVYVERIVRLNPNGSLDLSFEPNTANYGANSSINCVSLQSDGKILIAGSFLSFGSQNARRVARLNSNGTLDNSFNVGVSGPNSTVWSIDRQADGKVVIGGDFSTINSIPGYNGVARLTSSGDVDPSFTGSGANGTVRKVKIQPTDGKILIGGNFTTFNGTAKNSIVRLNTDGTLDANFGGIGANNFVVAIEIQSDGKILLGGDFTNYDNALANRFVRINTNGTLDGVFNSSNSTVRNIAIQSDGKIILVGQFDFNPTYNAIRLARLNADLSFDATFGNSAANSTVFTASVLSDGRIFIGGDFTIFGGQAKSRMALIQNCEGFVMGTASASPTICVDNSIPSITHSITGFQSTTGIGTGTNLPTGVTATYTNGTITIIGTPSVPGNYNYSIPMIGACQVSNATGTIVVNPNSTATVPVNTPTGCINANFSPFAIQTFNTSSIGTPTGLPQGLSASLVNGVITISGIPTESGSFTYTIPLLGNCASSNAIGNLIIRPDVSVVNPPLSYQCSVSPFQPIYINVANATSIGTPTGFTGGMAAGINGNTVTISGTNTPFAGTYNYSIPVNGLCKSDTIHGTLISVYVNDLIPADAMVDPPAVCLGQAIDTIKIATNPIVTSVGEGSTFPLPDGINFTFANDTIYIFGIATNPGASIITMEAYSPCGSDQISGNIVIESAFIFAGPPPTFAPVCVNSPLTSVIQPFGGADFDSTDNLPNGVIVTVIPFSPGAQSGLQFSGTPTESGTFNYSIYTSSNCASQVITGTLVVSAASVSVGAASSTPTVCTGSAIPSITHSITGTGTVGAATGLPAGVTASNVGGTITISGNVSVVGTYNYSIPVSGSCGTANATGTITVIAQNTVSAAPAATDNCINEPMTPITRTTSGATGIGTATGLPSGVSASWLNNTLTISGTPTQNGTFNYSIPLTGGCGTVAATGSFIIKAAVDCVQGVDEETVMNLILVPNPATEWVSIQNVSGDFQYYVTTCKGEQISVGNSKDGNSISIKDFAPGIYFVKVVSEMGQYQSRFIKQ